MWFKDLRLFQFTEKFNLTAEALTEQLASKAFIPCSNLAASTMGWVPPMEQEDAPLVHAANGFMMICLKMQEKIIPSTVIREILEEKVKEIEKEQDRKVYKKEKLRLRDEIYQDLLPKALCKSSRLYAYIDVQHNYMVVNSGSATKAEVLNTFLRKTIGSLKTILPEVQTPGVLMTHWLSHMNQLEDFVIEDFCVFKDNDDSGGSIRCNQQDLSSANIQSLVEEGKSVSQLGLSWCEQVSFVLHDDFSVHRMKYLEAVQAQADDIFTESEADRFDANFTIMTQTCRLLLNSLLEQFAKTDEVKQAVPEKEEALA